MPTWTVLWTVAKLDPPTLCMSARFRIPAGLLGTGALAESVGHWDEPVASRRLTHKDPASAPAPIDRPSWNPGSCTREGGGSSNFVVTHSTCTVHWKFSIPSCYTELQHRTLHNVSLTGQPVCSKVEWSFGILGSVRMKSWYNAQVLAARTSSDTNSQSKSKENTLFE